MRFTRTELSPANKKQYVMAMGKKDIELLHEIALMAHRYTPNTKALHDDKRRLASIAKAFAQAKASVEWDSDEGERLPLEERQAFKDKLAENPMAEINRLEIIDHRPCQDCDGVGHYNDQLCPTCQGMRTPGRSVVFWDDQTELKSSVQDQGRTLKLFVDRKETK